MPTAASKICTRCHQTYTGQHCPTCRAGNRQRSEQRRGTAASRGYGRRHQRVFRTGVLRRDPTCRCTDPTCTPTHRQPCGRLATIADHYPLTRAELVERGMDPDSPENGRGLCKECHDHSTATDSRTVGGWNRRGESGGAGRISGRGRA